MEYFFNHGVLISNTPGNSMALLIQFNSVLIQIAALLEEPI